MKFEKPSRIQAVTLPMVLQPPFVSLVAQASSSTPSAAKIATTLTEHLTTHILQAHNGSGKTTCFVLAMLSRVDPTLQQPQALCVCPTRELVVQNLSVLHRMGKFTSITSLSTAATDFELPRWSLLTRALLQIFQIRVTSRQTELGLGGGRAELTGGCRGTRITQQVVIGTHGKLKNWMGKRMLGLTCIKVLVMDEADEMLKVSGLHDALRSVQVSVS